MSSGYAVRHATADDIPEIVNLLKRSIGTEVIPRTTEYWEWKHLKNPAGPSAVLLAEKDNSIIGLRAFLRWNWQSGDRVVRTVRAVDTVTEPQARGRGIFTRLTRELLSEIIREEIRFVFNTPNRTSLPGYLKMGWTRAFKLPVFVRPVKYFHALKSLIRPERTRNVSLIAASDSQIAVDQFFKDSAVSDDNDHRYHTTKSRDYIQWRYEQNPVCNYEFRHRNENDALAMIIYRNQIRRGLRELTISEMLLSVHPRSVEVALDLLIEIENENSPDYMLAVAAADTPQHSVLTKRRFLKLPRGGPLVTIKSLSPPDAFPDPTNFKNWRTSVGDWELF